MQDGARGHIRMDRDTHGHWQVNGHVARDLESCTDVDFGFSPATNLMPAKRVMTAPAGVLDITAAWLLFPSLELVRSEQRYTRLREDRIRYEGENGYVNELGVDASGLVTSYPGLWERIGA
jgi:hypothetical protein